jgi:hypothetical protein
MSVSISWSLGDRNADATFLEMTADLQVAGK